MVARGSAALRFLRQDAFTKPAPNNLGVTIWKKINGWTYEWFERDVTPETMPGFEDMVRLWHGKRGGRPMPTWSDFDFADFAGWHGRIVLSEVHYEPFDLHYRLYGVEVVKRMQTDNTGKRYSELVAQGLEPAVDLEFYEMASREMLITRVSGDLRWLKRKHMTATFIEFPLSDTGDRPTHLLAAMI